MNLAAITNPAAPATQATLLSDAERARAAHLKGAALRAAAPAEQRAAVAAQFEAILVRQLLGKTMTSMMGSGDNAAGSVYGDLITDTLSQSLTAGRGLGLGRMIEQQLTPRGVPAAPSDAPAAGSISAHS
jgi:Rod binding domain-containing protein